MFNISVSLATEKDKIGRIDTFADYRLVRDWFTTVILMPALALLFKSFRVVKLKKSVANSEAHFYRQSMTALPKGDKFLPIF